MGRLYIAKFENSTERRVVASFSTNRAQLFCDIAAILEDYVGTFSGVQQHEGLDEHIVHAEQFVRFFKRLWKSGWLADSQNSIICGWTPLAAGIVENITLQPTNWIDRHGLVLPVQRYQLFDEKLESILQENKRNIPPDEVSSADNNTDIAI